MKTTLDLPDDLMRAVKIRAAENNSRLKDTVAELLRQGLSSPRDEQGRHRVKLPLIECAHPAAPDQELTPDRLADLLFEDEEARALGR